MAATPYVRTSNALDKAKLKLWSLPWEGSWRKASLEFEVYNNNVAIKCWSNNPAEDNTPDGKRPVMGRLGPIEAEIILLTLEDLATGLTTEPMNYTPMTTDNTPGATGLVVQSRIGIGRNSLGDITIRISEPNRKLPDFPITSSAWFLFNGSESNTYENRCKVSNMVTRAWVNKIRRAMDYVLETEHKDEKILAQERKERQAAREGRTASQVAESALGVAISDSLEFV